MKLSRMLESLAETTKAHVARALVPLAQRQDVLEAAIKAIPAGKDGRDGVDGKNGADGSNGKDGLPGERGADGLNGKDGAPGKDGEKGDPGLVGKSAYQSAVERGFSGTELQWLDAMQGRPGKDADPAEIRALSQSVETKASKQFIAEIMDEVCLGLGLAATGDAAPDLMLKDLSVALVELNKTMRAPIKPVYGDDGEIVEARRGVADAV